MLNSSESLVKRLFRWRNALIICLWYFRMVFSFLLRQCIVKTEITRMWKNFVSETLQDASFDTQADWRFEFTEEFTENLKLRDKHRRLCDVTTTWLLSTFSVWKICPSSSITSAVTCGAANNRVNINLAATSLINFHSTLFTHFPIYPNPLTCNHCIRSFSDRITHTKNIDGFCILIVVRIFPISEKGWNSWFLSK